MACLWTYFTVEFVYIFLSFIGTTCYIVTIFEVSEFRTDRPFNTEWSSSFWIGLLSTAVLLTFSLFSFYNFIINQTLLYSKRQAVHSHLDTYWYFYQQFVTYMKWFVFCISSFHYCILVIFIIVIFLFLPLLWLSQFHTDSPFHIEALYSLSFDRLFFTTSQCFFFFF